MAAQTQIIPAPDQQHITVTSMTRGGEGYRDGPAVQAQFKAPGGMAAMRDGSILVADQYNNCIRLISAN